MEAFAKWLGTLEKREQAAKAQALANFKRKYPHADMSEFETEVTFGAKNRATGEVYFKAGPGWLQNPEDVGRQNWSEALRSALGFGNFPYQLMLAESAKRPVPAVDFSESVASVGGLLNQTHKVYATQTEPVNRGFCLLRSRSAGQPSQQHSGRRRQGKRSAE